MYSITDIEETQKRTEEILEGPEVVIFKVYIEIINQHFLFLSPLGVDYCKLFSPKSELVYRNL